MGLITVKTKLGPGRILFRTLRPFNVKDGCIFHNSYFQDSFSRGVEFNFAIEAIEEKEKLKNLKNLKIGVDRCWKRWYDIQAVSENNAKQYRFISSLKITY